ncbi:MAG: carbohydrate-binding protein [Paludibacter sp.]|nr:carbohydrate-binding protein [Paludibacter sp.]
MIYQLLQGTKFQPKDMNAIKKEKNIIRQFLFVLLSLFLFITGLKAQESLQVGTSTRQMIVYAPTGIKQNSALVISMHGMNQTMTDQKNQTQFQSVAQANNFVLVFPQSIGSQWQLYGTTDTDFILAIIDEMYKRYGIDRDRVYLSGFSMGGMMTYYAATVIADKIAAFAPVSGYLMSGPNTNSSRPIPIIHVHGMDDGFVTYSNAQSHIDAWVKRNGCPTTPVVTKPYPANIPTSLSSKKYYGPGKEGVEVVFISVAGVGHWYSDNSGGVFTSQEIWNFCKNYSLKEGIPEFVSASVTDKNTKQIQVVLNKSVVKVNSFSGFTLKIDGKVATIDSVVSCDTNKVTINISQNILKDNAITVSYSNGNVVSTSLGKKMLNVTDKFVNNLLEGASPQIMEVTTNVDGNALLMKFSKKMQIPSDISAVALNAQFNGQISIPVPVQQCSFFNNDSTTLSFPLGSTVYRDYTLSLTYSGNNIVSADSGLMKIIANYPVTNNSNGLPVYINSGIIGSDGVTLSLEFSKAMALTYAQFGYFTLAINGKSVTSSGYVVLNNTIQLTLSKCLHYGDSLKVSYTPKGIMAEDKGLLDGFSNLVVANQISAPVWIPMPGKIEAENFNFKSGMQAETTTDIGGGQNLSNIADGNWTEYAIENNISNTGYLISFRVASPNTGGFINFYVDDKSAGNVSVPNTGDWQVFQSVARYISIAPGKHYLKVVATKAGFNFNYMDIQEKQTGIKKISDENLSIYPNPVSNEMIINSADFQYSKIEIFDLMGRVVSSKLTPGEAVLHLPVHLSDGIYFVKISNETQYQLKKFMVVHN